MVCAPLQWRSRGSSTRITPSEAVFASLPTSPKNSSSICDKPACSSRRAIRDFSVMAFTSLSAAWPALLLCERDALEAHPVLLPGVHVAGSLSRRSSRQSDCRTSNSSAVSRQLRPRLFSSLRSRHRTRRAALRETVAGNPHAGARDTAYALILWRPLRLLLSSAFQAGPQLPAQL